MVTTEQIEKALLDLLNGDCNWNEIEKRITKERCDEIKRIYKEIIEN